ncbi:MAG: IS4 family transposase [Polyangiaceae bacterium]
MIGHAVRAMALVRVVQALVLGGKAALTHLGRNRAGSAHVKHHIKAVDRLLGNHHLHGEIANIYRAIAQTLLCRIARPVLAVDWSDFECGDGRQWAMIQAAVPVGGRAVVVYSRVFPFKRYNSPAAHREFLRGLKTVLPDDCRPIIVTDAGFRGPWFREVEALGWDWLGRVRNKIKYLNDDTGRWCFTDSLYKLASPVTRYVGKVLLSRRHGYYFRLYLVRAYAPALGGRRKKDRGNANAKLYRRLHRAPWLLATSLPHVDGSERRVKQLYALRMQIEETLRDTKSHRLGFGLRYSRSRSPERIQVLVLVTALAALVLWLVGLAGTALNLTRHLQANTVTRRAVLSVPFIGRQLLLRRLLPFNVHILRDSMHRLTVLFALASAS